MSGLMAFAITFGATAAFGFLLIAKSGRQQRRRSYADTSGSDSPSDSSGSSFFDWFGHSGTDAPGSSIDSGSDGGSDSGGGSDGGGGGDGGGD